MQSIFKQCWGWTTSRQNQRQTRLWIGCCATIRIWTKTMVLYISTLLCKQWNSFSIQSLSVYHQTEFWFSFYSQFLSEKPAERLIFSVTWPCWYCISQQIKGTCSMKWVWLMVPLCLMLPFTYFPRQANQIGNSFQNDTEQILTQKNYPHVFFFNFVNPIFLQLTGY